MTLQIKTAPSRTSTLRHHTRTFLPFAFVRLIAATPLACGSPLDMPSSNNANQSVAWGTTEFFLTAELNGVQYALRDAEFSLTGPEEVLLRSNDYPNDATLVQELQSGQYALELKAGYRLVALTEGEESEVQAKLETPNPQTVLVAAEQTTAVNYLFRVEQQSVAFGRGSVALGLAIEAADPGGLLFSEFMVNPATLTDTQGEWIEIMNTASSDIDLNGCSIQRDDSSTTIAQSLVVPAGGFVTLSNGPSPGFTPTLEYSGFSLPNTAIFKLTLTCNEVVVDAVQVDPGSWPLAAGASASLDPEWATASKNDAGSAWCLANTSYGSDFGTPGEPNERCQP